MMSLCHPCCHETSEIVRLGGMVEWWMVDGGWYLVKTLSSIEREGGFEIIWNFTFIAG